MKITLSERASEQLTILLTYLELEWSPSVRDNFILTIERSFEAIAAFPQGFPVSEKFPGLR